MRLKKIRLAGFKSFVDPTTIPFPDDMTAIVGPNGCGKSNVIDAVRWVLGESSAKNLRGDAMTDVIFNGSTSRKPVSQCSVELVFDNTSQRIQGEFAAFNEISIKRVVTRDAQSNYFLNNTKCRRKDVTELFLGTGLGPRSYAIIEQGMISRLIESKPQELRVFIEEAAGISKYKERRRETENRIKHTRENLERLGDVRAELGQQLDKLQRQASAAKRYKELKAKERRYKGELAAIRWLHLNDVIADVEQRIQQQQTAIESYIAKQRGDEKEITLLKEQQADLKQQLSDTQHEFYLVGNEITKLEQNQQFTQQRKRQIEEELQRLATQLDTLQEQLGISDAEIEQVEAQLELLAPEQLMLEEQLEEADMRYQTLQEQWQDKQQQWRQKDQQENQLKQQVQGKHGEIQTLLQVQLRTEQRLTELQGLLDSTELDELQQELDELDDEFDAISEKHLNASETLESSKSALSEQRLFLEKVTKEYQQGLRTLHSLEAKVQNLREWLANQQESNQQVTDWLANQEGDSQHIWDYLQVNEEWQYAVETAMQQWQNSLVFTGQHQDSYAKGMALFFAAQFENFKPDNTLAQQCHNAQVPEWLARIEIADSLAQAKRRVVELPAGFSVITREGMWLGEDWLIAGLEAGQESKLQRIQEVQELELQLAQQQQSVDVLFEKVEDAEQTLQQQQDTVQSLSGQVQQSDIEKQHCDKKRQFIQQQLQKAQANKEKSQLEIIQYQEQLALEKEQLEELSLQVEELEEQLLILEEDNGDSEAERERMENAIRTAQQQLEEFKSKQHQIALSLQNLQHQKQSLETNRTRTDDDIASIVEKQESLRIELHSIQAPGEEQKQRLAELLEKQEQFRHAQQGIQSQLATIEQSLADAEKDQVGVMQEVGRMREQVQSLELERERNQTRANGFVEQLQEMQQSLKTILENLPEQYDEKEWQAELDKTTSGLSRLGAVNLAAVEEYDIQSERKQHLDTQNDDLEAALETLETAIRKIDKETKSRFKDTFERVNEDVKMLFPKVFGGGAAYLELTGEDLLETGVTIMARPPGKKNSTIHLLSGGEKALTALSLVFAIFRLNPAPFCLLDEVDAPLDDANVGRFCKLVSEMSKTVQFIFISHNKIAMEMAHHLTGVTMAEAGVSRIVAVDVEEAVAIANA
ncbi:MAG: chromosome segregation protein SMC [Aestuariibacter sp.]